jgi:hypothetical protein
VVELPPLRRDGIAVGDLPAAAGLPKARVLSNVGGMERWGYVSVGPDGEAPKEQRDGRGSSRGLRRDWVVRPTRAGVVASDAWPALLVETEARWRERFGVDVIDTLRRSSLSLIGSLDVGLPDFVPVIASTDGFVAGFSPEPRSDRPLPAQLGPQLAQVLLAYTLEFERESDLSLPLVANLARVVGTEGLLVRDVPAAAGISKEATSVALTALTRSGHALVEGRTAATKAVRLTDSGERAEAEFGGFRMALDSVLDHPDLATGLRPLPRGWRASKPYLSHTETLLRDPRGTLPHYPMVLHRGGWPDGS